MSWRRGYVIYSGQRGFPEEGTPGETSECPKDMGNMDVSGRAFQAEGLASAKAQRWACTCSFRGARGGYCGWNGEVEKAVKGGKVKEERGRQQKEQWALLGVSGSWECPRANLSSLVSQKHEHPEELAQLFQAGQALPPAPRSLQEATVPYTAREAESSDVT